ncbi:hypothetical protein ACFV7Q_09865 [Streptomyces sp. NPDC059851]|uniref:hypothetical protein n=1 Tax=Streptomyces sp. NPDC059851 TaxID=3346971 RepID=UPI003657C670
MAAFASVVAFPLLAALAIRAYRRHTEAKVYERPRSRLEPAAPETNTCVETYCECTRTIPSWEWAERQWPGAIVGGCPSAIDCPDCHRSAHEKGYPHMVLDASDGGCATYMCDPDCITTAPEDLLTAATRLIVGQTECRAQFEAEPTAFRWIFYREGTNVWIRLLELANGRDHDNTVTEIWSTQQNIDVVARAVIRCFDEVVREYGESAYRGKWGEHFPRTELEALRTAWREHRGDWAAPSTPSNP